MTGADSLSAGSAQPSFRIGDASTGGAQRAHAFGACAQCRVRGDPARGAGLSRGGAEGAGLPRAGGPEAELRGVGAACLEALAVAVPYPLAESPRRLMLHAVCRKDRHLAGAR